MNKLLKLFGFTKCWLCGKILRKKYAIIRRFSDSPKDFESGGYKAPVCEKCDYWCDGE